MGIDMLVFQTHNLLCGKRHSPSQLALGSRPLGSPLRGSKLSESIGKKEALGRCASSNAEDEFQCPHDGRELAHACRVFTGPHKLVVSGVISQYDSATDRGDVVELAVFATSNDKGPTGARACRDIVHLV